MENSFTRRAVVTSAPALACAPALAAPSPDDPLVALAAEYHKSYGEFANVPDELADQYADYLESIQTEMLKHAPITAAGAAALLSVMHHEISQRILWDEHPRMIESVMTFLNHQ